MRAIFLSYRREDTEGYAGRLFRDLRERFGSDGIFMDVVGIEPGRDFRRVIDQQVASCGVLLAMIGRNWLSLADATGKPRLDNPSDFVRLETAAALRRGIPVIPVLVHEAQMPRPEQLPDDLRDFAYRHAVELSHARWDSDLEVLVRALRRYVAEPSDVGAPSTAPSAAAASSPSPAERVAAGPVAQAPTSAPADSRPKARWLLSVALAALTVIAAMGGYVYWDKARTAARIEAEARRQAQERTERDAVAAREEAARLARERDAALARQQAEADRLQREQDLATRAAAEQATRERAAAELAEQGRLKREAAAAGAREEAARRGVAASVDSVDRITFDPGLGSKLSHEQWVTVRMSYTTSRSEGVRIIVTPLAGGAPVPRYRRSSPPVLRGTGNHSLGFTVVADDITVDGVKVEMLSVDQSQRLFERTVPARFVYGSAAPASGRPGDGALRILHASCNRLESGAHRLEFSGTAGGPDNVFLYAWSDGIAKQPPPPSFTMRCGEWREVSGNGCTRGDSPNRETRWAHTREWVSSRAPTYVEATLYRQRNPTPESQLASQRVSVTCP
jgi:hypothetical protein